MNGCDLSGSFGSNVNIFDADSCIDKSGLPVYASFSRAASTFLIRYSACLVLGRSVQVSHSPLFRSKKNLS